MYDTDEHYFKVTVATTHTFSNTYIVDKLVYYISKTSPSWMLNRNKPKHCLNIKPGSKVVRKF